MAVKIKRWRHDSIVIIVIVKGKKKSDKNYLF